MVLETRRIRGALPLDDRERAGSDIFRRQEGSRPVRQQAGGEGERILYSAADRQELPGLSQRGQQGADYGGFEKNKALLYNFLSALSAFSGALITYYLTFIRNIEQFLIPFAAGGFIYIAATDLMPELHKKHQMNESIIQLTTIITGIGLMSLLKIMLS